jgi:hypothetical protein
LIEEDPRLTLDEVRLAVSALAALGGRGHEEAVSVLGHLGGGRGV